MNKTEPLLILIKSLSKSEKRYFRLYSGLQSGDKAYRLLFDLLDAGYSEEEIGLQFRQKDKSLDIAVKYLYKLILDCLVKLRETQNIQTKIFNHISKGEILFERELSGEAFNELAKAEKLAVTFENGPLILLTRRIKLKYLGALNFKGISEQELVSKQMKVNEVIKYLRNVNQHLQLYDILKYRLMYKGYSRTNKQKEDLNDLVLSELYLIANSSYQGFEAQKLHLLFQATYYLNSGNIKSAIRYYRELITLFEENTHLILNPPIYYRSAIQGILDSLLVAGLYHEMPFFLSKLRDMEQKDYPTGFVLEAKAMRYHYDSCRLVHSGHFEEAKNLLDTEGEELFEKISLLGLENQLKLHLNAVIIYMCIGKLPFARKCMKRIFSSGKLFSPFPSYKLVRLINLLLQAESGNYDFFENEILSIKRNINYERQSYQTEKLLFKFVQSYPLPTYGKSRAKLWQQYQKTIQKIECSKYERQLLKVFDFTSWIEHKLTRRPLAEILIGKAAG